jgi:hypothetical protein
MTALSFLTLCFCRPRIGQKEISEARDAGPSKEHDLSARAPSFRTAQTATRTTLRSSGSHSDNSDSAPSELPGAAAPTSSLSQARLLGGDRSRDTTIHDVKDRTSSSSSELDQVGSVAISQFLLAAASSAQLSIQATLYPSFRLTQPALALRIFNRVTFSLLEAWSGHQNWDMPCAVFCL